MFEFQLWALSVLIGVPVGAVVYAAGIRAGRTTSPPETVPRIVITGIGKLDRAHLMVCRDLIDAELRTRPDGA